MERLQKSSDKSFLQRILKSLHSYNPFVYSTLQDITMVNKTVEFYIGSKWYQCNLAKEIDETIQSISQLYKVHHIIKSEYNIVLKHNTPTTSHYYENGNKHSYPEFTNPLHIYCKRPDIETFEGIVSRYYQKKYGKTPDLKYASDVKKYVSHYHIREWVKEIKPLYIKFIMQEHLLD